MKALVWICLTLGCAWPCLAQDSLATPTITLGIPLPLVNQPASVQVLVSNPNGLPAPTGTVTIDFGDGSTPATLTLTDLRAATVHSYTTLGTFTLTASYSGDGNFAPETKSLTTISAPSAPVYTLTEFGDSLTGALAANWPTLLTGALGWPQHDQACGGCKTNDMAAAIYATTVNATSASTWMLGQNDGISTAAYQTQFRQAALAENAWLAIPEGPAKLRAQNSAVAQTGPWAASDISTTTGLRSIAPGSTLTATVPGSALYVGLSSTLATDSTVQILIDGVVMGTYTPQASYAGEYTSAEPYGLRFALGGDRTATHTVQAVCIDPGTSGCSVDWFGGNGAAARPNLPPYVWTGVTYRTAQPDPNNVVDIRSSLVRSIESQLQSDGLPIRLADIEAVYSSAAAPDCAGDGVHPAACGNQIEETVWLSAMDFLATEAQRIDTVEAPQGRVGATMDLDEATATSGLPVTYAVLSGPGALAGSQLAAQGPGPIVVEATQAGNATVLPAAAVRFTVNAMLPTATALAAQPASPRVGSSVDLHAQVAGSDGSAIASGSVTFYDGSSALGSVSLDGSGTASLSTAALAIGDHSLTAQYTGASFDLPSASGAAQVTVLPPPPDFTLTATPDDLVLPRGTSGGLSLIVTPLNGFDEALSLTCSGLPAATACSFSGARAANGDKVYKVTVEPQPKAALVLHSGRPSGSDAPFYALLLPLSGLWVAMGRRKRGRALRRMLLAAFAATALAGLSACGSSSIPATASVAITAQSDSGLTHTVRFTLTLN